MPGKIVDSLRNESVSAEDSVVPTPCSFDISAGERDFKVDGIDIVENLESVKSFRDDCRFTLDVHLGSTRGTTIVRVEGVHSLVRVFRLLDLEDVADAFRRTSRFASSDADELELELQILKKNRVAELS